MNYQLALDGRAGEVPNHRRDYNPQKNEIETMINRLMRIPCDFILTAHLKKEEELISIDRSTGIRETIVEYVIYITGQAVLTVPLLFDEVYVLAGESSRLGTSPRRQLITESLGRYTARSRLNREGILKTVEEPDIKVILKKAGYDTEDKPRIEL